MKAGANVTRYMDEDVQQQSWPSTWDRPLSIRYSHEIRFADDGPRNFAGRAGECENSTKGASFMMLPPSPQEEIAFDEARSACVV